MGDPAQDFAALMSGAAAAAAPPASDAPYGYTRDRDTGELRPKKVPGRPRARPPSVEELKAAQDGSPEEPSGPRNSPPAEDRAPDEKGKHGRPGVVEDPVTPYVPGVIARGMNRLYKRAGKIVKAFDPAVGAALIEVTRKDDDDDLTVGEAWEELAKTNPRIRRFLMRLITGGAYGQLLMAHAPVLLAIMMKPAVLRHIPFARLIEALAADDEDQADEEPGSSPGQGLLNGLEAADLQQMAGFAQGLMANFGSRAGASPAPGAGLAPQQAA
jgi:hypothetical protein